MTANTDVLDWLTADDLRSETTVEGKAAAAAEIDRIRQFLGAREIDLRAVLGFVTGTLAPLFASRNAELATVYWCPKWWYHLDALDRFDILMRLYVTDAEDAELRSNWWLAHAKPHMDDLTLYAGGDVCGFYGCSIRHGHRAIRKRPLPSALPATPPPAELALVEPVPVIAA